jgi:hypothetical protein
LESFKIEKRKRESEEKNQKKKRQNVLDTLFSVLMTDPNQNATLKEGEK